MSLVLASVLVLREKAVAYVTAIYFRFIRRRRRRPTTVDVTTTTTMLKNVEVVASTVYPASATSPAADITLRHASLALHAVACLLELHVRC